MSRGMTVAEAARRAERSRQTISTWMREGMPFTQDGREKRILLSDLQAEIRKRALARKERGATLANRRGLGAL